MPEETAYVPPECSLLDEMVVLHVHCVPRREHVSASAPSFPQGRQTVEYTDVNERL